MNKYSSTVVILAVIILAGALLYFLPQLLAQTGGSLNSSNQNISDTQNIADEGTQLGLGNSQQGSVQPPADVPQDVTLQGHFTCLPHKNTGGPVTMECAFGLETDDGKYYALDATAVSPSPLADMTTGKQVSITGLLVPADQLNTDQWQKYDIVGIMQVKTAKKLL